MADTSVDNTLSRAAAGALIGTVLAYYLDNWCEDHPLPEGVTVEGLASALETVYGTQVLAEQMAILPILKAGLKGRPSLMAALGLKVHENAENIMLGAEYDALAFGRMIVAMLHDQQLNEFIVLCRTKATLTKAAAK